MVYIKNLFFTTWIPVVILELIHASSPDLVTGRGAFIRFKPSGGVLFTGGVLLFDGES